MAAKKRMKNIFVSAKKLLPAFQPKNDLKECYHQMSSQKNKAMNKSIMRNTPKDKT
jgi:hypothetical protein